MTKGTAWAVSLVVVASAAPAIAASEPGPAPNSDANYYWSGVPGPNGESVYTSLVPATGTNSATFSTQISYQSDPYKNPPVDPTLIVTVTFNQPVTITSATANGWTSNPYPGPSASFIFTKSEGTSQGSSLSFNVEAESSGTLTSSATLEVQNAEFPDGSGSATWTSAVGQASTTVSS